MKNKINICTKNQRLRIYIDSLLHVSIDVQEIVGIKSYKINNIYYIDYYTTSTTIDCNYTNGIIWKRILRQLAKLKII